MSNGGRLAGLVVLVTGAARGIGRACALRLADEGASLVLTDVGQSIANLAYDTAKAAQLEQVADEVRSRGANVVSAFADVRDLGQLQQAVDVGLDRFQQFDGLVAAAGIDSWGNSWDLTEEQWQMMIDINLTGVWKSARAVAPCMIQRGSGSMVFVASVLGHKPNRQFAHYTAAKHGVVGLAKAMALELAPFNIRVNTVDPTAVATEMITNQAYLDHAVGHPNATLEEAQALNLRWNALPIPWVEAVDVANAAVFLLSNEARYITGASLPVDAGALLT